MGTIPYHLTIMTVQDLIQGLIFDMDGVLVDSNEAHFQAFKALGDKLKVPFSRDMLLKTVGMHNNEILPLWLGAHMALPPERIKELAAEKEALYRAVAAKSLQPTPGAGDCAQAMKDAGFKLAVGSSGPRLNVELGMKCAGVTELMNAVVTGDCVTRGKPAPDIFLLAAKRLGLRPEECCVIEDAPQGVQAALNAGMRVIALTTTKPKEEPSHAHAVIKNLTQLTAALVRGK